MWSIPPSDFFAQQRRVGRFGSEPTSRGWTCGLLNRKNESNAPRFSSWSILGPHDSRYVGSVSRLLASVYTISDDERLDVSSWGRELVTRASTMANYGASKDPLQDLAVENGVS